MIIAEHSPAAGQVGVGGRRGEAQGVGAHKVEHTFLYVKRHFATRGRATGLAKNTQRFALPLGFSNLPIADRYATG